MLSTLSAFVGFEEIDAGPMAFLFVWTSFALSLGVIGLLGRGALIELSMSGGVLRSKRAVGPLRWTKRIRAVEGIDLKRVVTRHRHRSVISVCLVARIEGEEEKVVLSDWNANDPHQVFLWLQQNTNVPGEDRREEEPLAVS